MALVINAIDGWQNASTITNKKSKVTLHVLVSNTTATGKRMWCICSLVMNLYYIYVINSYCLSIFIYVCIRILSDLIAQYHNYVGKFSR